MCKKLELASSSGYVLMERMLFSSKILFKPRAWHNRLLLLLCVGIGVHVRDKRLGDHGRLTADTSSILPVTGMQKIACFTGI